MLIFWQLHFLTKSPARVTLKPWQVQMTMQDVAMTIQDVSRKKLKTARHSLISLFEIGLQQCVFQKELNDKKVQKKHVNKTIECIRIIISQ